MSSIRLFGLEIGFFLQFGFEIFFFFFTIWTGHYSKEKQRTLLASTRLLGSERVSRGCLHRCHYELFSFGCFFVCFLWPHAPNPFCGNLICIVGAEGRGGVEGGNAGGEGGSSKVFCLRFEIHIMFCIALFVFCIWSSWAGHLSIIFYFLSLVFVFLASWEGVQFLVNIYTIYCLNFYHPF